MTGLDYPRVVAPVETPMPLVERVMRLEHDMAEIHQALDRMNEIIGRLQHEVIA